MGFLPSTLQHRLALLALGPRALLRVDSCQAAAAAVASVLPSTVEFTERLLCPRPHPGGWDEANSLESLLLGACASVGDKPEASKLVKRWGSCKPLPGDLTGRWRGLRAQGTGSAVPVWGHGPDTQIQAVKCSLRGSCYDLGKPPGAF